MAVSVTWWQNVQMCMSITWRTALAWEIFGLASGSLLILASSSLLRSPTVQMFLCVSSTINAFVHFSFVVRRAAIHSIGSLQFTSCGKNASWLFRSSVAVSFTDPCDTRPLRSGELWPSDVIPDKVQRIYCVQHHISWHKEPSKTVAT